MALNDGTGGPDVGTGLRGSGILRSQLWLLDGEDKSFWELMLPPLLPSTLGRENEAERKGQKWVVWLDRKE